MNTMSATETPIAPQIAIPDGSDWSPIHLTSDMRSPAIQEALGAE